MKTNRKDREDSGRAKGDKSVSGLSEFEVLREIHLGEVHQAAAESAALERSHQAATGLRTHGDALFYCPPRLRGPQSSATTCVIQRHMQRTNSPCLFRNVTHPITKLQR